MPSVSGPLIPCLINYSPDQPAHSLSLIRNASMRLQNVVEYIDRENVTLSDYAINPFMPSVPLKGQWQTV